MYSKEMEEYKTNEKIYRFEDIDLSGTYTYADYLNWEIDKRLELIRGKIFPMGGPATRHQRVSMKISANLYYFLKNKTCEVFTAPFDIRFTHGSLEDNKINTVLQPDICVICNQRNIDAKGGIGTPDIVVEILSPGNTKKELKYKYEVYQEFGVSEYWVIQPEEKLIFQYVLDERGKFLLPMVLSERDIITSSVLPGFTLSIEEVFG